MPKHARAFRCCTACVPCSMQQGGRSPHCRESPPCTAPAIDGTSGGSSDACAFVMESQQRPMTSDKPGSRDATKDATTLAPALLTGTAPSCPSNVWLAGTLLVCGSTTAMSANEMLKPARVSRCERLAFRFTVGSAGFCESDGWRLRGGSKVETMVVMVERAACCRSVCTPTAEISPAQNGRPSSRVDRSHHPKQTPAHLGLVPSRQHPASGNMAIVVFV
jgi:hypothetical protein